MSAPTTEYSAISDLPASRVGPQGTLFGKNQTGGAVLFTSQSPTDEFGGFATVTIGNFDARRLEAAINIPLTEDFQIRVAGLLNRRDGYVYNVTDERYYEDQNTDGWRVSAHYAPASVPIENWLIVAGASEAENGGLPLIRRDRLGSGGVGNAGIFTAFGNPAGDALLNASIRSQVLSFGEREGAGISRYQLANGDNVRVKNFSVTNKTELSLGDDLTLRNIFGYRYLRSYQSANVNGIAGFLMQPGTTAFNASAARLLLPAVNGVPQPAGNIVCGPQSGVNCVVAGAFDNFNYTQQRQVSEEVNLLGKALDGKLDFILGAYYFREHGTGITSNFVPVSNGSRMGTSQNQPANSSKALSASSRSIRSRRCPSPAAYGRPGITARRMPAR